MVKMIYIKYGLVGLLASIVSDVISGKIGLQRFSGADWTVGIACLVTGLAVTFFLERRTNNDVDNLARKSD
jgi:hypothetical protein